MSAPSLSRIPVTVPEGLEDVCPVYLESKKQEMAQYQRWAEELNFSQIEKASHKLKGSAGGYGFDRLGELAADLNHAAKSHDFSRIESVLHQIQEYLNQVELVSPGSRID